MPIVIPIKIFGLYLMGRFQSKGEIVLKLLCKLLYLNPLKHCRLAGCGSFDVPKSLGLKWLKNGIPKKHLTILNLLDFSVIRLQQSLLLLGNTRFM